MLTPNNLALPSGCIQKNIEKKYFSKNFCLPCYTSPLNMTIRWAMTIIIGCNKVCLCVSSRIWTKGSPPDLALSCVPFAIPSSRSPPSRGLKAWCQQSPRWTGSMNRFSFQALFRSRQWRQRLQTCVLSNNQQAVILMPFTDFFSSFFLLLGTWPPSLQHPGSFSVPAAAWVQTQSRRWCCLWETLRSKWGRAKRRRREAAWSSSLRKENGRVRWTADGWDRLFRSADRRGGSMRGSEGIVIAELVRSLSPSSCPRSRSSAATPTCLSPMKRPCCWPMQTQGRCLPSLVCKIQIRWVPPVIWEHSESKLEVATWEGFVGNPSFQFITYCIDYRAQYLNWYTHSSFGLSGVLLCKMGLERSVLHSVWWASVSPSCPAWLC